MVYNTAKTKRLFSRLLASIVLLNVAVGYAKTDVPVFLLTGQSNMTGYASANDLTSDQKKSIDNVKIYMDLTWEGDDSKERKWLTLGPGFGSSGSNIGPELFLGKILSDSMPGRKIAFVKVCCGSTYLGNYSAKASDCWVPPSSNNGTAGAHYKRMLTSIDAALKAFNSAYDTTQYTPRWAGFVWLQGEFDGQDQNLANAYEANLTCLINDVRKDLKVSDLPIIIPMIDVQSSWQYNSKIRAAEVAVTKKLKNVDTLDTKGFPTDNVHYKAQGQVKIGTIAAQRWITMKFTYSPTATVSPLSLITVKKQPGLANPVSFTSLNGRQVIGSDYIHNGIFIRQTGSGIFRYSPFFSK
jgi:Carbohydrate esterase, sialic acid-specific acetylesterase